MNATPKIIGIDHVRHLLRLPNYLIHDFTSYEFNGKKLVWYDKDKLLFDETVVFDFKQHLDSRWPADKREPPEPIKRYLVWEASNRCALCREEKGDYEFAHIKDWVKSYSHNPHNLLYLCVACHSKWTKRTQDHPTKLLQLTKEELLREKGLIPGDLLFDCDDGTEVGDAVHIREDGALRAIAMDSKHHLATCFVACIIGLRCTVVRVGIVIGIRGLIANETYYLSPTRPGKVDVFPVIMAEYNSLNLLNTHRQPYWQRVGRAESVSRLVIQFEQGIGMPSPL